MRVIEKKMVNAFMNNINTRSGNDKVIANNGITTWYYHGNPIAEKSIDGTALSNCGWNTTTTKSRLNALLSRLKPGNYISQHKFVWYINDIPWKNDYLL